MNMANNGDMFKTNYIQLQECTGCISTDMKISIGGGGGIEVEEFAVIVTCL